MNSGNNTQQKEKLNKNIEVIEKNHTKMLELKTTMKTIFKNAIQSFSIIINWKKESVNLITNVFKVSIQSRKKKTTMKNGKESLQNYGT